MKTINTKHRKQVEVAQLNTQYVFQQSIPYTQESVKGLLTNSDLYATVELISLENKGIETIVVTLTEAGVKFFNKELYGTGLIKA